MSRGALLDALLDRPGYQLLYLENAHFHQAIDVMLSALPEWIDKLAQGAVIQEKELLEEMRRVMYGEIPTALLLVAEAEAEEEVVGPVPRKPRKRSQGR